MRIRLDAKRVFKFSCRQHKKSRSRSQELALKLSVPQRVNVCSWRRTRLPRARTCFYSTRVRRRAFRTCHTAGYLSETDWGRSDAMTQVARAGDARHSDLNWFLTDITLHQRWTQSNRAINSGKNPTHKTENITSIFFQFSNVTNPDFSCENERNKLKYYYNNISYLSSQNCLSAQSEPGARVIASSATASPVLMSQWAGAKENKTFSQK